MIFTNAFTPISNESPKWEKTEDGFLRCKACVLMQSIMPYAKSELEGVPDGFTNSSIQMYVPIDEIAAESALRSLEGMPIVAGDHTWMTPELVSDYSMGNVSGVPWIENDRLICNLLVTNPDAIAAIENGTIGEISGAYRAETEFSPGTFNNEAFDAVQKNLLWNHIAVIPKGHGRGGAEVRILNQKKQEEVKMTVRIKLRNTGKYINVDEEVAPAIEADQDAGETKAAGMDDKISQLEEKNAGLEALQAEIEELKGELSVYKEKLDELLSEEAVEGAAEGMIEENGEAGEIVENLFPTDKEKEKQELKNSLRKIHGTKLHNAVLTAIGVNTEGMSAEAMKGAFKAQHQIANAMKGKKVVAGAKMIQNTAEDTGGGSNQRTGLERLGFTVVK
jgi:hypothetical protein